MYNTIITQLEKALKSKDDKELRLRVEVLLDMLKDQQPRPMPQPVQSSQSVPSALPQQTPQIQQTSPKVNGAGAIVSNGEQINYTRPKGT